MEFLTQTIFAFAVIGYIYSIKDHKKKSSIILFVISLICLAAYIEIGRASCRERV